MSTLSVILTATIPSVITAAVTLYITKKSQIKDNTEALKTLISRLGLKKDYTLIGKLTNQYNSISADIGRNENASLSKQHQNIEAELHKSFGQIKERYDTEDNAYRAFTVQQRDLKQTLDNFSRDYFECVKENQKLNQQILSVREENKQLQLENRKLKESIKSLQKDQEIYPFPDQKKGGDNSLYSQSDEDEFEL